ncbi:metal-dependent hydrolase [Halocatena marina]|uniref:metal-dependent hydrolase n=1 Tax=Halocatena marina TaxID=2934937 RepID=UPI00200FA324|nr:metal-dependent hydrolase [Halocatena marina]
MFVGHGLLAFAVVALFTRRMGWSRERALSLGLIACAFGTIPDVDMLYAPIGLFAGAGGLLERAENFWTASTLVHRTVTHSLIVGSIGALGATAWTGDTQSRHVGIVLLSLLVAITTLLSGGLAGAIMLVFTLAVLAVATAAGRLGFGSRAVFGAALFGLLSHPFGDVFTGAPPQFLYPLSMQLIEGRVAVSQSPTLHLLGAVGIELATMWLAAIAFCSIADRQLRDHIEPWAVLGVVYAVAVPTIPPPTLALSYPFVVSVLGVGVVCSVPRLDPRRHEWLTAAVTGLTAVTVAVLTYVVTYNILKI